MEQSGPGSVGVGQRWRDCGTSCEAAPDLDRLWAGASLHPSERSVLPGTAAVARRSHIKDLHPVMSATGDMLDSALPRFITAAGRGGRPVLDQVKVGMPTAISWTSVRIQPRTYPEHWSRDRVIGREMA